MVMYHRKATTKTRPQILRYTHLAATIHLLREEKITLLNPASWDDKNDAYYMDRFRRCRNARTVLALCFAEGYERYHHWKVFASGANGVCIRFDKERLLSSLPSSGTIIRGSVKYVPVQKITEKDLTEANLPFVKRSPYKDEKEYRIVYVDVDQTIDSKDFEISLGSVQQITLSPWMPEQLADAVKGFLQPICRPHRIQISHSNLVNSERWKEAANNIQ